MPTDAGSQPPQRGAGSMFGALSGIATLNAVLVLLGVALGYLLDEATSAPHVFLFLGLLAGIAAGVLSTRTIVRRYFRS